MSWKHALVGLVGGSLAVAVAVGIALAEEKKDQPTMPKMDPQTEAMMAEMAKYAAPGPEHKYLDPLIGKWTTSNKSWMAPGEPYVSAGTAEYSWILDGRFMTYSAKGDMWGQPFNGFEILGYDRRAKTFTAVWVDNTSTALYSIKSGSYDAATKTFTFNAEWPNPMAQGNTPYKLTTKINSPDSHVFAMYDLSGGKETKLMETTYTRVK